MNALNNLARGLSKNSPTILTSMGVVGVFSTAVLAVRGTPKAIRIIEDYKQHHGLVTISKVDTIKLVWKCYVPSVTMGLVASGCIISAHVVSLRRTAALASLYTLTDTALKEYQHKVEETLGPKKEGLIRDAIDKDHIKNNPVKESEITFTGNGSVLVYDVLSGRYFTSDINKIKQIINEANHRLLTANWMTLNELYLDLGLKGISLGENVGWDINAGLIEPRFSSQLTEDERPCLVLNLEVKPLP